MEYNPEDWNHRKVLAATMVAMLTDAGFTEEIPDDRGFYTTRERVFSRRVNDSIRVMVYTTVVGDEARRVGRDAIRVAAVYTARDGQDRGIARGSKRVNRVGMVTAIVDRTLARMREVWKIASHPERCHCGAPMFKSKKGNLVCADICWSRAA